MIVFKIKETDVPNHRHNKGPRGWKAMPRFKLKLAELLRKDKRTSSADVFTDCVVKACEQTFPRRKGSKSNRTQAYWRTSEIGILRNKCLQARRRSTNTNKRASSTKDEKERMWEEYKEARRTLRKAILEAKREACNKVMQDLDQDIFGQGYRIVVKKIKTYKLSENRQLEIAKGLFPQMEPVDWGLMHEELPSPTPFKENELLKRSLV